jgi:D-glycero-D-manno-heptose 1,7-bisphosphate phosphatase
MLSDLISEIKASKKWTLFLDRDGIINKQIKNDYVKSWNQFEFQEDSLEFLSNCNPIFKYIFIVTNQQGIGKKLMTIEDLAVIHKNMLKRIASENGRVDKIYCCTALKEENNPDRKPNIGMALKVKSDFSDIIFNNSLIIGDSISDIEFGLKLNMHTIYCNNKNSCAIADYNISKLSEIRI